MTTGATDDTCAYVLGDGAVGRWPEPHAGAWFGFLHAHRQLTRELDGALDEQHHLSLSRLELLGRLAAAHGRRLRLSALADATGLSLSRVSRAVDDLERTGLAERQVCPEDARATNVWLTDHGVTVAREVQESHARDVQRVFFDPLTERELATLSRVFGKLARVS